jgi:hypothetical protein
MTMIKRLTLALAIVGALALMLFWTLGCSPPAAENVAGAAGGNMHVVSLDITTDATKWVTVTGPALIGQLYAARWEHGDLEGASLAFTLTETGEMVHTIMSVVTPTVVTDAIFYPREIAHVGSTALTGNTAMTRTLPLLSGQQLVLYVTGGNVADNKGRLVLYWIN